MKHIIVSYIYILNKLLLIFICYFLLHSFTKAEPKYTFKILASIPIDAKEIQTDRIGNLYIISKTNQLYKYSTQGKLLSTLNYKYNGNISKIDVSNSLEIYVFYKELNTIIFLDNNLAYRGEINLSNYDIAQATAAARSYDNGIWLFDIADLQLKKLNKDGKINQQSGAARQYTQAKNIMPNYIYDNNDRVYVNDSNIGIMVFDVFANYIKTIPIKGVEDFKIIGNEIYFNKQKNLFLYNVKTYEQNAIQLPDSTTIIKSSIEKERLYLMKENAVEIYEIVQ